jgi:hypothetical protein
MSRNWKIAGILFLIVFITYIVLTTNNEPVNDPDGLTADLNRRMAPSINQSKRFIIWAVIILGVPAIIRLMRKK